MKRFALVPLALVLTALSCPAQNSVDGFVARVFKSESRQTMPYRLFVPKGYDKSKKYPLVLWLHGTGGSGKDNLKQISESSKIGTHIWTRPENQAKYPAFVLAPQCPETAAGWDTTGTDGFSRELLLVLAILDSLKMEFSIDSERIYISGQSMGGYGTWDFITKKPEVFAAAIPLCGGGDISRADRLVDMPIWAFHGDADKTIPVNESRKMIAAIRKFGGNPRYTEYKGVGHEVWELAFREPEIVDWLFAQHK